MTSMMEKPQSKKAKTYNRFNGKQDHGDAHEGKGHEDFGYWEQRWKERGATNTDKTYLKEVIRDGLSAREIMRHDLDERDITVDPHELEAEADRILAEQESEAWAEEFEGRQAFLDYDKDTEDGMGHTDYLKFLDNKLKELRTELESIPHLNENDPDFKSTDQARLEIEGELLEVVAEIRELLNQNDFPEAAYGVASKRDIRNRMARAATMDDYSEDDFGDTEQESAIRVHKIR